MSPNIKEVNFGFNRYCGPSVLSILTGIDTDRCATVIKSVNPSFKGKGCFTNDLLRAADKLGFNQKNIQVLGGRGATLFSVIVQLANNHGIYLVVIKEHFVTLEINPSGAYFCDNATGKPIRASSSARLSQGVLEVFQLLKRAELIEAPIKQDPKKYKVEMVVSTLSKDDLYNIVVRTLAKEDVIVKEFKHNAI